MSETAEPVQHRISVAGDLFDISSLCNGRLSSAALEWLAPLVERTLAIDRCRELLDTARVGGSGPIDQRLLAALDVAAVVSAADLHGLPRTGPLIVAANHPHGALDGLLLADVVRRVRGDVRVLATRMLASIPDLHDLCFFVDPFESSFAAWRSRAGLRLGYEWLRRGGALVVFPSGEVAHVDGGNVTRHDSAWKPTFARLAEATNALVVPAFVDGANSELFYAAGRLHPMLRTALLGRELLKARGRHVRIAIGQPMSRVTRRHADDVRHAVEALRTRRRPGVKDQEEIANEIGRLPLECCLVESGPFRVFCTAADAIPATLTEIGRLRETTYRDVGEGTGRDIDVDRFDSEYLHLFSWDSARRCVVGAYRLGRTDKIVASRGVDGLYTRTLFDYDTRLLERLGGPALELGRSFVRAEYQKNYNALLLLWKGLGQFVTRHPEYRVLFGPVSISARYSDSSHQLLGSFLLQNHLHADLARLVSAIHPAPIVPPRASALAPRSIDEVDELVARSEQDRKGVPVLLRQYLKLNAQLLGFNVDPAFGDAVDALMMVDLLHVDPAILNRYLGRAGAAAFRAYHQQAQSSCAA